MLSALYDFTIATWVKIDTLSTWSRIFDFGTGTSAYMFLTPRANGTGGPLRFAITTNGNGSEQQLNGPVLSAGAWYHIAVTLQGNTATLYVNGVAVATNAAVTIHPTALGNTPNNYLGKSQFADPAFLGSIDDFRIFSRALSATEVSRLVFPVVMNSAAASANPVVTPTTSLSVLGSDITAGESALTYTWTTTGTPPAPVSFSTNGTNAAKNTVVTFTTPGTYNFQVTIVNPAAGFTTISTTSVMVGPIRISGDFNLDGQFTVDDIPPMFAALTDLATFQSQHYLSNAEMLAIGDLNGDQKLTNLDLQALLDHVPQGGGAAATETQLSIAPAASVGGGQLGENASAIAITAASPAQLLQTNIESSPPPMASSVLLSQRQTPETITFHTPLQNSIIGSIEVTPTECLVKIAPSLMLRGQSSETDPAVALPKNSSANSSASLDPSDAEREFSIRRRKQFLGRMQLDEEIFGHQWAALKSN